MTEVPPCVYAHAKRPHTYVKDPVVHVRVRWIMKAQKNPALAKIVSLQDVEIGDHMEE